MKCSQVDDLIANVQAQIEKLRAYRQSVITEVVIKGLDPTVPMKDSGFDWIGSIPAHWDKLRVKYIGDTQNGISKGGEYFGSGYPFISYGDVYRNMELPHSVVGLIESTDAERENYSVKKGDIFFTRTSETIEEVGFSSVCTETIKDATAKRLTSWSPTTSSSAVCLPLTWISGTACPRKISRCSLTPAHRLRLSSANSSPVALRDAIMNRL